MIRACLSSGHAFSPCCLGLARIPRPAAFSAVLLSNLLQNQQGTAHPLQQLPSDLLKERTSQVMVPCTVLVKALLKVWGHLRVNLTHFPHWPASAELVQ
jgi:hypothetical protein